MSYQITGHTRLTGLLGHPVAHSISPQMHNEAFRTLGLDYAYLAFDITPEQLADTVKGLLAMNARGFNLTMPFKTQIIPYLDDLSQAARLSHSVNTVVNEDGRLIGHTTDGVGYMNSVKDAGVNIIGKKMVLLGAGGAATSIITQAALDGVSAISVFKRRNTSFHETEAFAAAITKSTGCQVHVYDMKDTYQLKEEIDRSAILVNATNVGMGEDHTSLVPKEYLRPELVVSDIIYNPFMTKLLSDASDCGCTYFNGLYMLLFQGAESFRLWTNAEMPIEHIKTTCFS